MKRITITLNEKTESELFKIMDKFGFNSQSQAACFAIAQYLTEFESAERWMNEFSRLASRKFQASESSLESRE